jgi:glycosyltransferase involved in cell wall biosynthesis
MKISVVVNAHNNSELLEDTVDAIRTYCSDQILVVVDGSSWEWAKSLKSPASYLKGFNHNTFKSPYRNLTYGLMNAVEKWPDSDWYCYCENDVLFASNGFMLDLVEADKQNIWCLGTNITIADVKFPYLERIFGIDIQRSVYLLGCCAFYNGKFLRHLKKLDFFQKFLTYTNGFEKGFFPQYTGYDIGEHLYPTLADHYGGQVMQLSAWYSKWEKWDGDYRKYPIRWKPELTEDYPESSIMHPLKDVNHPIRKVHREKRKNGRV